MRHIKFGVTLTSRPVAVMAPPLALLASLMLFESRNHDQQPPNLDEKTRAALEQWNNVGAPGPAPAYPFVPSEEQQQNLKPMISPRVIAIAWKFSPESYPKLQFGHEAQEMRDKWNMYMQEGVVQFHRSWTGSETFRFAVTAVGDEYSVDKFEVEQDPGHYTVTDEQTIKSDLVQVLKNVLRIEGPLEV